MPVNLDLKILIVEDFSFTRKVQVDELQALGFHRILEASNGNEAIRLLETEKDIDLIISDWNMPEISGYDLLVWIRSRESLKEIPFVMATAQAEKKEANRAAEAGVTGFLTKPFSREELGKVIDQIFDPEKKEKNGREIRQHKSEKTRIRIAHIQITDHVILGVLNHLIENETFSPEQFELETLCMSGWNPVRSAIETGEVDGAFMLAPVAMDLFSEGIPIRIPLLAHKNGSICVQNAETASEKSIRKRFRNKCFFIPHVLSIHHMLSSMFFREIGLMGGLVGRKGTDLIFEVVPPVRMPDFLSKNPDAAGFMVAQPIGADAMEKGSARLLFRSGEVWENHPCCVLAVRAELIEKHEDAVSELIDLLVRSGRYVHEQPEEAARITVNFLDPQKRIGLAESLIYDVLTEPNGIRTDDLYPNIEDLDGMQRYMKDRMNIGTPVDLEKILDFRFADVFCGKNDAAEKKGSVRDFSEILENIIHRML